MIIDQSSSVWAVEDDLIRKRRARAVIRFLWELSIWLDGALRPNHHRIMAMAL